MIDGNLYDDLTRTEKDNYLLFAKDRAWVATNKDTLAQMAKDAKNEKRRDERRKHKILPLYANHDYSVRNMVGLMPLPQFERWIYGRIDEG